MDKNLTQNIEFIGEWFLPSSDTKISGIFRYKDGQSTLKLLDSFPVDGRSTEISHTIKTVHGRTQNGLVTLTDVIFSFPYTYGSVYSAIFGKLLDDDHKINGIAFEFDLLNEWAISKHPHKDAQKNFGADTLEKYEFTIGDVKCTLFISLGMSVSHLEGTHSYNMSHFILKSEKGKKLVDFYNYVLGIKYLLMLAMGRNLNLNSMNMLSESSQINDIFLPISEKKITGSEIDHFFNIRFIHDNYTNVLTNWFDFYLKNKYLLKMFFKTMDENTVESLDFFVYASLLEGYYKYNHEGETDYKKRIRVVLQPFVNDFSNLSEFINMVEKMRHDNFHFNKRDELDEDVLHRITHDLYFLIRIIFLNHIGLDITIDTPRRKLDFKFLKRK